MGKEIIGIYINILEPHDHRDVAVSHYTGWFKGIAESGVEIGDNLIEHGLAEEWELILYKYETIYIYIY